MTNEYLTMEKPDSYQLDSELWTRGRNVLLLLLLVSWLASAAGLLVDTKQFSQSYLVAFIYFITIGLGALFFVMVQFLTGSAWSIPVRRFMETAGASFPVGILLFIPIAFTLPQLYEWARPSNDPLIHAKAGYLNPTFFVIRAVFYLGVWSVWGRNIYKQSTQQDSTRSIGNMRAASRWSGPGLLLVILTGSMAAFDWVMSLDPRWYSTIFGIYLLSGGGVAFMALITLIALAFRRAGVLKGTINVEHYHDLGKWMFALTVFWAYIAFSQYLLIWYANLPEETIFYKTRLTGTWTHWSALLLIGHFIIPFLVLLARAAKRNMVTLGVMAGWILAMHFVDVYWLIMPNFYKQGAHLSWIDFATFFAVGSAFVLAFWRRLGRKALVPVGDLRFEQGLAFKNI
jgi:hypothetical protein